jgi:hypothetical protein
MSSGPGRWVRQDLVCVRRVFPLRLAEQLFETIDACASHDDDVLQIGKARLETGNHLLMVEAAELFRHDDDLAGAVLQHERKFALPENMHQGVDDGADARAREIGQRELPPVRQLHGNDVVPANAEPRKANSNAVRHRRHLPMGEAPDLAAFQRHRCQRQLVGTRCDAGIQIVVDGPVAPKALRDHGSAAWWQQYGVEVHGFSFSRSAGPVF